MRKVQREHKEEKSKKSILNRGRAEEKKKITKGLGAREKKCRHQRGD